VDPEALEEGLNTSDDDISGDEVAATEHYLQVG
jgi:hypothetical protein